MIGELLDRSTRAPIRLRRLFDPTTLLRCRVFPLSPLRGDRTFTTSQTEGVQMKARWNILRLQEYTVMWGRGRS